MGDPMSETGSLKPGRFIWISMSRDLGSPHGAKASTHSIVGIDIYI